MNIPRLVALGAVLLGVTACKDDSNGGPDTDERAGAYVRYINGTYQMGRPGTPVVETTVDPSGVVTTVTRTDVVHTAMTIDVLIDSSETGASVMSLPPNSVSAGNSGPEPANLSTGGYRGVSRGVHSFVARKTSTTSTPGYSFYTTSTPSEYLPKQHLLSKTTYTLAITGEQVASDDTGDLMNPPENIPFTLLRDDPFYPATMLVNGQETLLGRYRVYNMAPYHTTTVLSGSISFYLTSEPIDPASLSKHVVAGSPTSYRSANAYSNVPPKTYYATAVTGFSTDARIVWSGQTTFQPGEVKSFVILNDMPTYTITTIQTTTIQPSGNSSTQTTRSAPLPTFKVIELTENQW